MLLEATNEDVAPSDDATLHGEVKALLVTVYATTATALASGLSSA